MLLSAAMYTAPQHHGNPADMARSVAMVPNVSLDTIEFHLHLHLQPYLLLHLHLDLNLLLFLLLLLLLLLLIPRLLLLLRLLLDMNLHLHLHPHPHPHLLLHLHLHLHRHHQRHRRYCQCAEELCFQCFSMSKPSSAQLTVMHGVRLHPHPHLAAVTRPTHLNDLKNTKIHD